MARGRGALRGGARPLRFLAFILASWVLTRALAHWNAISPSPQVRPATPLAWKPDVSPSWAPIALFGDLVMAAPVLTTVSTVRRPLPAFAQHFDGPTSAGVGDDIPPVMQRQWMPTLPQPRERAVATGPARTTTDAVPFVAPKAADRPYWANRQLAGWSLGGWAFVRPGDEGTSAGGIAAASQLGGGQAGLRLAYGFGDSGSVRAYSRATMALSQPRQRDLAFGFAFAPVGQVPVDVAVEQRLAVGSQGRTALAVMVTGGVGDVALPGRFQFEAYGQAGFVGARRRDEFADAAVVVDREIVHMPRASLHLGALAAGSMQPGVGRVDVGPRLTLRLPDVGGGSRIALDWRQRVAGDARPGSGAALTLATDF